MTTETAAALYLAQHLAACSDKKWAVYNPHDKSPNELPVIYGFNNGGSEDWWDAQLVAEDGTSLGGHVCSREGYMPYDLGILEGARLDRHEDFKKHYPDGYRMEFVEYKAVRDHNGLQQAFEKNKENGKTNLQENKCAGVGQ